MHLDTMDRALSAALARGDLDEFERLAQVADTEQEARRARLTQVGALAGTAVWYALRGIAVFPLRPGTKAPLFARAHPADDPCRGECGRVGHGLYDATTDPDRVDAWWRATPLANIGMPTGHRWDVIDIDGPAGYASLADLKDEGLLPAILARAWTPGGGQHLYVAPTGDGNATKFKPGMDYRGMGGYVVVPPSIGANRKPYDWIMPPEVG